ncbi:MAG TPA: hypothetical protein G4O10_10935 [Dehalococcoidia bacterium]|nr:hypothetical protein [Dehalococcoidia bacterium]
MTHKQNSCPRCGGNLFFAREEYDWYLYCLQCGHIIELERENESSHHDSKARWEPLPSPILQRGRR